MKHAVSAEDQAFRQSIQALTYPVPDFDHRAHLRLAYIYLTEFEDTGRAVSAMRSSLLALLKHAGVEPSEKYHETITEAWILAVKHFMVNSAASVSADQFIDKNPVLLDSSIMLSHYSKEVLFSDEARVNFLPPDLDPIPLYAG